MADQSHPSPAAPGFLRRIGFQPLDALLLMLPAVVILWLLGVTGLWMFVVSAIAIVPLAGLMGRSTESLSAAMGPAVGGLLNATFGNAAELILGLIVLAHGEFELVKASITGSIIGNALLVMGAAILGGGLRYKKQKFNAAAAGMGTSLLALASIALLVPAVYHHTARGAAESLTSLSEEIAVILACVYVLSLIFALWTHDELFAGTAPPCPEAEPRQHTWGRRTAILVLLLATTAVALMSELLVNSVTGATQALGMNEVFIGVVVVAVVGNAAEHATAVTAALKNDMDLALHIAVGSSTQVALLIAPVLVGASWLMGQSPPLDLHFTMLETVAVGFALVAIALVAHDGETHWMEGILLLAVYLILALAFYHLPSGQMGK